MRKLILLALLCVIPFFVNAQNTGIGILPFGSYTQGGFDTINNQDLNVIFSIPIVSSAGRNMPLNLALTYNSQIFQFSGGFIFPATNWGWQWDFPPGGTTGYTSTDSNPVKCLKAGWPLWVTNTYYSNYYFIDALGTYHSFPNIHWTDAGCGDTWSGTGSSYASDNTGYYMTTSQGTINSVKGAGGQQYPNSSTAVDSNGNFVTRNVINSTETDWKDSVGNVALKILYTPNSTSPTQIQYQFLDQSGAYQTMTLTFQTLNIATNFGCSSPAVTEYTGTATLPTELDIPTPAGGTLKYLFAYEPTTSGHYSGRLQKVTLPTGGSYEYDYPSPNDGVNCSDGSALNMNRKVSDGTNSATWTYARNTSNLTTTVTTPQLADTPNANNAVYTFNSSGREIARKIYSDTSNNTALRTFNTTWATNNTPATSITILEDGSTQNEVATTYDSNGLLQSQTEYDWGSGAPGGPIRTTGYSYLSYIINRVTTKFVKDGSGTVQYRQDIGYDGAALTCPTGAAQHDETGPYTCSSNARGNPTSVTTYTSPATPSGGITKNFTYDWFGNLLTAQLNCCTSKTWTYSSTYQYSQPTQVTSGTSPTQLTTSYTYNQYTGLVLTSTDPNNLVTTSTYDFLRRPTQVSQANGQTVTYSYNDTTFVTSITTTIDSSKSVQQVSSVVDGLGRVLTATTKDGSGNVISNVDAKYDLIGRAWKTSNPYTGTASYFTTTQFDVLGRPLSVTLPDNSATTYSYAVQSGVVTTTVTDAAGKKRKSQVDGAGRLNVLTEPDASNTLNTGTYYTYNVLDELTGVADAASNPTQTRTYTYDALGRLFTSTTPEGGTTCFGTKSGGSCTANTGYDNYDNLLYRTDARGVVTSYGYDGLNRPTSVSYNVTGTNVPATASVGFTYGASGCSTAHGSGCVGQFITMTDGVGSENYSYNALEQLTQLQKVINSTTYTTSYAYNIAGELTQITYPSGRVIQQSVDAIGRLCEIAPSSPTGCGSASNPYATGYSYNVAGQLTGFRYGNNIYASLGYSSNGRLQLNCLDYSTTNRGQSCTHDGTTKFGLTYTYGSAGSNNGLIAGITDSVDNGRSVAYTYDPLSRLSTAVTTGSANYPAWNLSWGYDRYGNRLNQTLNSGPGYQSLVQVSVSTNRITCIGVPGQSCTGGVIPTYDASGNMTYDGSNTLTYDAENKVVSATNSSASGTYTYDGNGLRVKKVSGSTTTVTIFSGSKVIAEYNNGAAPSSPTNEYIYSGGQIVALIQSGTTHYFHNDHLSIRFRTDTTGAVTDQRGTYPFGDQWYSTSGNVPWMFTTYERDSESSNDYAMARYYRWLLGRFLSLDPLSGSTSDPQSLNRYTYVENNPIIAADPSGMIICLVGDIDGGCQGGSAGGSFGPGDQFGGSFTFMGGDSSTGPGGDTGPGMVLGLGDGQPSQGDSTATVTSTPIDVFTDSWMISGVLSEHSYSDQGPGVTWAVVRSLIKAVAKDPNCLSFLGAKGANVFKTMKTSTINIDAISPDPTYGATTTNIQYPSPGSPNPGVPISYQITVNSTGYAATAIPNTQVAFPGLLQGQIVYTGIQPGTPRALGFTLLHEFGHATGVLAPDKNNQANETLNNNLTWNKCKKAIQGLSNSTSSQ